MKDSKILRRAAQILKARSSKPNGWWLRVLVAVLLDQAHMLEEEGR